MRTSEHQNIRTLVVVAVVVYPREAVAGCRPGAEGAAQSLGAEEHPFREEEHPFREEEHPFREEEARSLARTLARTLARHPSTDFPIAVASVAGVSARP